MTVPPLSVEEGINLDVIDALRLHGVPEGLHFVAVTGKQEEHVLVPQFPHRLQYGLHILHGAHVAEIGHGEAVLCHLPEGIVFSVRRHGAVIGVPVGDDLNGVFRIIPVGQNVGLHFAGQRHNPVCLAADTAVDVVHEPADGIPLPQCSGHRSYLRVQVVGHKHQLRTKQGFCPGHDPWENWRVGVDHDGAVMAKPGQVQQNHKGEGEIVDNAPQKAGAIQLDVLEAADVDALHRLLCGNIVPVQILSGVAAEHIHGISRFCERLRRIKGQLGRGDILRIKKLAGKQNVLFLLHLHPSVSAMDSSKDLMQ